MTYEETHKVALGVALRKLHDRSEAEDVAQVVAIRLHRESPSVRQVRQAARNVCRDFNRQHKRRAKSSSELYSTALQKDDVWRATLQLIKDADLGEVATEVMRLRMEGHSQEVIAKRMQLPRRKVAELLGSAAKQLGLNEPD